MITSTEKALKDWARANNIEIHNDERLNSRFYFYKSNNAGGVFQIIIEPEVDNIIRIDVHIIDSFDNEFYHSIYNIDKIIIICLFDCSLFSSPKLLLY